MSRSHTRAIRPRGQRAHGRPIKSIRTGLAVLTGSNLSSLSQSFYESSC